MLVNEGKPSQSSAAAPADPVASPPAGRARARVTALIIAWLAVQVAVPASYYLAGESTEERFAWRMFSDITAAHRYCTVAVIEYASGSTSGSAVRDVDLAATLHGGWERHMQLYRRAVIDRFLRWRCAGTRRVSAVEIRRTCPVEWESRMPSSVDRLACPAAPEP